MSIKLVLEMEAGDQLPAENNEVEAANVATEVEAATSELAEVGGEAEEYAEGIETSVDAAGELQEVHDTLAASVEDGEGVSEETAKMAEIAVEAICAKVGISAREARMIPAMESFGSANSRLTATKLAMEGIKETAKRIWEAIKKACIHVWNVIKNFFAGLTKSRTMLEKHLTNLKARAAAANGTPDKKTFSTGAKEFSINGKATLKNVEVVLADSAKATVVGVEISNSLKNTVNKITSEQLTPISVKDCFKSLAVNQGWNGEKNGEDGQAYGNFVKGRALVLTEGKADDEGFKKITFTIAEVEKNFAKEIDAPSKQDIMKVVEAAIETLASLRSYDKVSKEIEGLNKAMVAFADEFTKKMEKMAEKSDNEYSKDESKYSESIRTMNSIIAKIGTSVPNMVFAACKAAADYANAGLNNLKTEKK